MHVGLMCYKMIIKNQERERERERDYICDSWCALVPTPSARLAPVQLQSLEIPEESS